MSDEVTTIAAVISAIAAAAGAGTATYSATRPAPKPPVAPTTPKISAADSAASGLLRGDLMGGATPSWGGGQGPTTLAGSRAVGGGGTATEIGSLGQQADGMSAVLDRFLEGGGLGG